VKGTVAALALAAAACGSPPPDRSTGWHQETGFRWRQLVVVRNGRAGFTMLKASATGLTHRNDVDDEHALANRGLLDGAGVALGDVDGDGRPDIFLASVERPAALYHNDGGFRFSDVSKASGLDFTGVATSSAVLADVDGDGDLDLIVGTFGGPVMLFLNDGKGHFTDATATSGLSGGYLATTMTLADVDGNGTLDLYVATYKTQNALDVYPPQVRAFDQVLRKIGDSVVVADGWKKEYRVESRPDLGGFMRSQRGEPDLFFLNDGKGHFTRQPVTGPRFTDEQGKPLKEDPDYFSLAARFYDVNGDGAPDLYVCNDLEDPDLFWLNDGKGNFRLAPQTALRETANTCMSVDFADVNRDGFVDIFSSDMLSPTLEARQRQVPTHTPMQKPVGASPERTQWMRNMLHVSRGDGTWAQIADFAGVTATDWTWGTAFLDVDLDGYEDLLAANGHRWDVREADPFERIRNSFPRVPWNRESAEFPKLTTKSIAMRNGGDLTFQDASRVWGFGVDDAISQGIALADLDGDGALDVVVTRLDGPSVVYRNESGAPRISVRLRGAAPNTQGIGAVVTVRTATLPAQSREMTSGGYYLSGSDAQLTFATGRDTTATIEVRWRSGRRSVVAARTNRLYEIDEAGASASAAVEPAAGAARPSLPSAICHLPSGACPLFINATSLLSGASHVDSLFADFRRQPLLPGRLSQLGPGVSWIDVDGDGREDLVFGTGRGGTLSVLRNTGGKFSRLAVGGGPARFDLTTVLPAPDGHGGVALLAGQSNYESSSPAEALAVATVLGFPVHGALSAPAAHGALSAPAAHGALIAPAAMTGGDTASIGPLAMADVNGDGRLDLFVGARAIAGAWPLPAPSHLFLRTASGAFVLDTANAKVLASIGLVSAAVFADLDGDGHPDLVVATDWGPVRVLHNENGRLRDVTREYGLAGLTSRWNGVAVGDFDGDGRLDIVATSWGRNIPWKASEARPYQLVAGNFGGVGLGLVFARKDSLSGREMPLDPFSRLGAGIPSVKERFATYAAFAKADVNALLGDYARQAVRAEANTFDQTLFLNRGGRFEARSLPTAAQLAPAFAAVVADFDGDGHEDLFLAQNFFPTEINTMRFDAGAGLMLLGDGAGGFSAQPVQASGLSILGDQRGAAAADYDGDGRVDLAVSQNGAPMTLWHNTGGKPGLRVRLEGPAENPRGIGAQLRVVAGATRGPVRELHAGSGYWSMDGATTVLALPENATALWVRWPNGREQTVPLALGRTTMTIRAR
jgi:hypothetical protein